MRPHVEITPARLESQIRRLARENPEFRYDSGPEGGNCSYLPDENNPMGCIVGAALTALGLVHEELEELEGDGASQALAAATDTVSHIWTWANDVQRAQDATFPWTEAIRYADGEVNLFPEEGE